MSTGSGPVVRTAPILSITRSNGARWLNITTPKWNGYPVRCFAFGQN